MNPWAITINLNKELGEAIKTLIHSTSDYGEATFIIKEFLEKHKVALIKIWDKQGKNGNEIYNKWFRKWSMTRTEQKQDKLRREQEALQKRIDEYIALGYSPTKAFEFATLFDESPIKVIKTLSYKEQTNIGIEKQKFKPKPKLQVEIEFCEQRLSEAKEKGTNPENIEYWENRLEKAKQTKNP